MANWWAAKSEKTDALHDEAAFWRFFRFWVANLSLQPVGNAVDKWLQNVPDR